MKLGTLEFLPVQANQLLLGMPVKESIAKNNLSDVLVAKINPDLSDTAAFCGAYQIGLEVSVNCVIVEAKRAEHVWYAACLIPAAVRADINGIVRRELDARKISFAPMEKAVTYSHMEYGGISPIGLPKDWPLLVDSAAAELELAIIGSGIRKSKLLVSGRLLADLPGAKVMPLTKTSNPDADASLG